MSQADALHHAHQVLWTGLLVSSPILLVIAVIGLAFGILQALTQVQEQSLPMLAKLGGTALVLALAGSWMLTRMVDLLVTVLEQLPTVAR